MLDITLTHEQQQSGRANSGINGNKNEHGEAIQQSKSIAKFIKKKR